MKSIWRLTGLMSIICCMAASCSELWPEKDWKDKLTGYDKVFLHYALGFNNLTSYLENNIDEMCGSEVPDRHSGNVFLVLSHATSRSYDYKTRTCPCLYRVYKENGKVVRDTLVRYPDFTIAASAGTMRSVLSYVKDEFPSRSYGMVFTSHGTGWIPEGYDYNPERGGNRFSRLSAFELPKDPLTKSAGMHVSYDSSGDQILYGIEIDDFVQSIPMHMDYIIFDACLMGCAEVAYQFKDVCSRLVLSPTEIMARGMDYTNMLEHLFNPGGADIERVAEDYYNKYSENSNASVCVVDCSQMDRLAAVCKDIVANHRNGLRTIDRSRTQHLFYDDKEWFYDLRDIALNIGATQEELTRLDEALASCITYERHTDRFFQLKLERVCGLSMYLPIASSIKLNTFYRRLAWNDATDLVI